MSAEQFGRESTRSGDRFIWQPLVIAAVLWFATIAPATVIDVISLPLPMFLLVLAALIVLVIAFAIVFLSALVRRRWRRAVAIVIAPLAFFVATVPAFHFRDDIKVALARRSILAELNSRGFADETRSQPKIDRLLSRLSDQWSFLEYDHTDEDAPALGQNTKTWISQNLVQLDNVVIRGGCRISVKRLDGHFYLKTVDCNQPQRGLSD